MSDDQSKIKKSKNVVTGGEFNVEGNLHIGDIININQVVAGTKEGRSANIPSSNLQSIRDLLVDDKIKEALEALLVYTKEKDPDLHNDIIAQSGRWNRLRKDKRQGIITSDESQIIHNRIRYSILSIIEDLE